MDDHGFDEFDCGQVSSEENGSDSGGEVPPDESAPVISKRRLGLKTPAAQTEFPHNRLVTRVALKRLKGIEREANTKRIRLDKQASSRAERAVQSQPSLVMHEEATLPPAVSESDGVDLLAPLEILQPGPGHFDVDDMRAPHPTHDLRRMISHPITYCNTCGHWARQNRHSLLVIRCEEIKRGFRNTLKLLQNDVVPEAGAKIPAAARVKRGRPSR